MLGSQYISKQLGKQVQRIMVRRPKLRVRVGALVRLPDGREAFVQFVRISPYYAEEKQGIRRAYVYSAKWDHGDKWTDYVLPSECEVIG